MHAKKSLGQNFLNHEASIQKIASCVDEYFTEGDLILEIGPGRGALTKELLKNKRKVLAVEADGELVIHLSSLFKKEITSGDLILVHADILAYDEELIREYASRYHIVANIPYYITGAILRKFLSSTFAPISMTLVMQKEVADRIVMHDKKTSILALSVCAYATPLHQMTIPAEHFSPAPRVDSSVITLHSISRDTFIDASHEELFFELVHAGFAHKRKYVIHNLKLYGATYNWAEGLAVYGYSVQIRAEDISIVDWIDLARQYKETRV